jgi:hypothetical protein
MALGIYNAGVMDEYETTKILRDFGFDMQTAQWAIAQVKRRF